MMNLKLQQICCKTLRAYGRANWKTIPVKECRQPLVLVPKNICFPYYAIMKLARSEKIYIRQGVLKKILIARACLQKRDYDLRVYDGWRSVELQENLF